MPQGETDVRPVSERATSPMLSDTEANDTGRLTAAVATMSPSAAVTERMFISYPAAASTSLELPVERPVYSHAPALAASASSFSPGSGQNMAEDYRQQPHMSLAAAITAGKTANNPRRICMHIG